MTVKELIQQLGKLPPDREIWTVEARHAGVPGLQVADDDGDGDELAFIEAPNPPGWEDPKLPAWLGWAG